MYAVGAHQGYLIFPDQKSQATASKHRQNIFRKLDVHCERDALLVAHQGGLFSPLATPML